MLAELEAKGLAPAAAGRAPDLVVTFHILGQELIDSTSNADTGGFGWGPGVWGGGWGWYGGRGGWGALGEDATTFTSEHPRDTLILTISMADAKQKMLGLARSGDH